MTQPVAGQLGMVVIINVILVPLGWIALALLMVKPNPSRTTFDVLELIPVEHASLFSFWRSRLHVEDGGVGSRNGLTWP